jgi:hypothetical protein
MNSPSRTTTMTARYIEPDVLPPALHGAPSWQDAVCTLIDHYTTHDLCFSSGEIAAELRLQRPDLRFAVHEIGEYVKDLFHGGAIEYRDRHGRTTAAIQVPRRTSGSSRTPPDTEVFVYAPTPIQGLAHAFEVDIPHPAFTPTAVERRRFAAAAAQAGEPMIATVHGDGRLCIPRRAIEQLSHATGISLRGGDSIYVARVGDGLRIGLQPTSGPSLACALQPERGRVRFSSPDLGQPFEPGDRFGITIEGAVLRIDLRPLA